MARQAAAGSPHLSVIVLVYDEVDSIEPLHRELMGVLEGLSSSFEVLYIDDGSGDGSVERLVQLASREPRVRVVGFRRNFGQAAAVQAGIDHSHGDVLVLMDGDMQNDPHDIPQLLAKIDAGYDVVCGWCRERSWFSRAASWIVARLSGLEVSDFGCTLKAIRREVVEGARLGGEMHRLLPAYASGVGARITELPVARRPRTYGRSKRSPARSVRLAQDVLSLRLRGGAAGSPIYSLGLASLVLWALALLCGAVVIVQRLVPPYVHVHANLLVVLAVGLVIVGVQLLVAAFTIPGSQPAYVVREVVESRSVRLATHSN
jgi:dolichol-phosphate mannosyltransferase